jgi:hypothetical protein
MAFQTFSIQRPAGQGYWRKGTCEESGCKFWRDGWVTRVPRNSPQEKYIISGQSGRDYYETTGIGPAEREFMFAPGQQCFQSHEHRVPIEREPLYVVRDGDGRGNPTGRKRVIRDGVEWKDRFAEELGKVADDRKQG